MADKNFNQGNQSHQSNQDWERNRMNQENDWSYGNAGNSGQSNRNYNDVGYSGDSAWGMNSGNQGRYSRNENSQYGSSGNSDYGSSGLNYNAGGYQNEERGRYGNTSNNQGQSDWNRRREYGNQYGNEGNWRQSQQGGNWGNSYGEQGRHYGQMKEGFDNDYRQSDWNRKRYGGHNRNENNANFGGVVNNLWEKAKDKMSSWFNDDDDRYGRNRDFGAGHRGKGPKDYRRSEERIREDICDRLTDDDRIDASHIRVQMENDVVILSGTVNSREEKRRAEVLVESISGVRDVENRLRIGNSLSSGAFGTDSGTTGDIIRNQGLDRTAGS